MSRLLEPLNDTQQELVALLAATYRKRGHWPHWQFVEASMERNGADPVALVASLPSIGMQQGIYGFSYGLVWTRGTFGSLYQPSDPIGLTVAGWHHADGGGEVVRLFLDTLGLAVRRLNEFIPDPERVVHVLLNSTDVVASLTNNFGGALPLDMRQVYEVLEPEPLMWLGSRQISENGEWQWEVTRAVRRYGEVQTVEDYVAVISSLAEEAAEEVERLPLVQWAKAPTATELLTWEPGYAATEIDTQPPAVQQPVLFLSWGGPTSKRVAATLKPLFEEQLPGVEVFFSPISIMPGADPQERLYDDSLLRSKALVVVLTREGAGRPYVVWETAAAWAQGQLVVPIFVDIEAGEVPGPLTTKVQGIRIEDRDDFGRAIKQLKDRFSVNDPKKITDDCWAKLVSAVSEATANATTYPDGGAQSPIMPEALRTFPSPRLPVVAAGWPRKKLPIYGYGPTTWFQWSGPEPPDVTLRIAIALPDAVPRTHSDDTVSKLKGERRETAVLDALHRSPLTAWLKAQKDVWHWKDDPVWRPHGSGYPNFSEYRFVPRWPQTASRRTPFQALVGVATGLVPTTSGSAPAIQVACDLMFSLLELEADRRAGNTRYFTTPAPAPAALSFTEIAEALLSAPPNHRRRHRYFRRPIGRRGILKRPGRRLDAA